MVVSLGSIVELVLGWKLVSTGVNALGFTLGVVDVLKLGLYERIDLDSLVVSS